VSFAGLVRSNLVLCWSAGFPVELVTVSLPRSAATPTSVALSPRLLEQRQQEDAAKLDALRRAVATGVADIDEGRFTVIDTDHIAATIAGLGESAVKCSARRRAVSKRGSAR
jgi:hypothetical protein